MIYSNKLAKLKNNPKEFIIQYLSRLGLSSEYCEIYYTLLCSGDATILQLSRITGIERTRIYGIVERMKELEIIEEAAEHNKKLLKPANLDKLEMLINSEIIKSTYLKDNLQAFSDHIKYFIKSYSPTETKFYRGIDGIKQVLWNELHTKTTILGYSCIDLFTIAGYPKFGVQYTREFEARKLTFKDLRSLSYLQTRVEYSGKRPLKGQTRRFIDPEILNPTIGLEIYDNTVITYEWYKSEPISIEIINKNFAEMQRKMFMHFWKLAKPWDYEKLKRKYLQPNRAAL